MTAPTFPAALVEEMAQRQHEMRRERYPLSVTLPWGDISDDDKEAVRECVRGVLSALPAAVQAVARGEAVAQVWQPIATAPTGDAGTRDAPDVLVYASQAHGLRGFMAVTHWHPDGGWCVDELRAITHWMPLPAAPAQEPQR